MTRIFFIMFTLIFLHFFSCGKNDVDLSQIQNLNGNKISSFGHSGMGIASQFPINSFESIMSAINIGVDGVEIDIQMTKDSVLILFHDKELEASTNLEGFVYEKTWAEIQEGIYSNPPFAEYRIISLDQLFENIENKHDLLFSLDFKSHEQDHPDFYIQRNWNALIKIIDKHDMEDNIFVESKRKIYLEKLKALRPDWKLFFLAGFEAGFDFAIDNDLYGMVMPKHFINKEQIAEAHNAGLRISLFDLKTKDDNLEAIDLSPDFLQTDKVKHLVKVLN